MSLSATIINRFLGEFPKASPSAIERLRAIIDEETKTKRVRQTLGVGIPPDPLDVEAYSASIGYPLNGKKWCDNYAQKGWVVSGRARMKDWRAAVRNWAANGWGQEGGIALRKVAPKPPDVRYQGEPQGDWRKTARRVLNVEALPENWLTWGDTPPDYRAKILQAHSP